jgi:type IV fimbrial biogenesis protein FimT
MRGFSLVELMVVLVILAILVGIGVPSFRRMTANNRLATSANLIVTALQTARAEAIRRNQRVMLCPTTTGANCSGSNWNRFIVFQVAPGASTASPGSVSPAAATSVILEVDLRAGGLTVQGSSNVAASNRIWFASDGLARMGASTTRSGAVSVCTTQALVSENTRDVTVGTSRVAVQSRGSAACSALTDS